MTQSPASFVILVRDIHAPTNCGADDGSVGSKWGEDEKK